MATYKVIQDIEAEDKILGPLTLRQFIYTLIMCFFLYLSFVSVAKGFAWALSFLIPPALFTGFLAFPFRRDQPTEVWAVAKFSFLFKPRKRIWDQSGLRELVTITVPKKVERVYTNGLSQTEVQSRLSALANTIDSRGWAIKNVNVNLYAQPGIIDDSDRLVGMSSIPQPVPDYSVQASDDILDENSSPIAQQFTQMITAKETAHRQQLMNKMSGGAALSEGHPATSSSSGMEWFENKAAGVVESSLPNAMTFAEAAMPTEEDLALIEKIKAENHSSSQTYNSHLHTLQPLADKPAQPAKPLEPAAPRPDPTIQYLARKDGYSIASLAKEAQQSKLSDNRDEVVISLR